MFAIALLAVNGGETVKVPAQLGQSFDISDMNVWEMKPIHAKNVLKWGTNSGADEFPKECLTTPNPTDAGCASSIKTMVTNFNTATNALSKWKNEFGLDMSGSAGKDEMGAELAANVATAFTNSQTGTLSNAKSGAIRQTVARNSCSIMKAECVGVKDESAPITINPDFLKKVTDFAAMGTDPSGRNKDLMEAWEHIVTEFGSHVAVALDHGAAIRRVATSTANGLANAQAATKKVCVGVQGSVAGAEKSADTQTAKGSDRRRAAVPVPASADVAVCNSSSNEDSKDVTDENIEMDCTAIGGLPSMRGTVCSSETTDNVAAFLDTGGLNDDHTYKKDSDNVIGMSVKSIADIWFSTEAYSAQTFDIKRTLMKAADYHACKKLEANDPNSRQWDFASGTCQCTRTCHDRGVVDPDTCTCLCFGDGMHGYKGKDCSQEYGKCQSASNSGDPGQSSKCGDLGNICRSYQGRIGDREQCDAGQVCCATWYSGTCCPFGYECGHRRWWKRPLSNPSTSTSQNEDWDRNGSGQQVYRGCTSSSCDACIPPKGKYNGGAVMNDINLATLFPAGTDLPSVLGDISHPSWKAMKYGQTWGGSGTGTAASRGYFKGDNDAGRSARGVGEESELEARLERLVEVIQKLEDEEH